MLAGMYVGACIVLIFTIGGTLSKDFPAVVQLVMGVCFGGALTFVIFAGSELFTGSNLVLTLGVLTGKASERDLAANWVWTWVGNLLGSALLAVMVDPLRRAGGRRRSTAFVLKVVKTKMNLPAEQLFWRAVLANWLVCLGVWLAARTKSDTGPHPADLVVHVHLHHLRLRAQRRQHVRPAARAPAPARRAPPASPGAGTPTTSALATPATSSAGRCSWPACTGSAAPSRRRTRGA